MRPQQPPPLWWNGQGKIACRVHVPRPPSEAFWSARWQPIGASERASYRQAAGEEPRCDGCVLDEQIDAADHELWEETDRDAGSPEWSADDESGGAA